MTTPAPAAAPLLLVNVRPVGFDKAVKAATDLLIGADGRIIALGSGLDAPVDAQRIDAAGAWLSPGWCDLHTHVWRGGTDISIAPALCGLQRGVTTIVDAGSAGEANFAGLREFIIEPAEERIRAFLNIGSIGLVACNRVSELIDMRSIDIDRTLACVEANRDLIVGIKIRASATILGSWGLEPVKIAKRVARLLKLPLMAHVGEPPPLIDDVLRELDPGDIVTHCFNGKAGGNILDDEALYQQAVECAERGVRMDVGHGGASFSFRVAKAAIARGLLPFSISTDLHARSLVNPVWDMGTTMSKLLALGMPFEAVVTAASTAPASVVGLPSTGLLKPGTHAEFTLFDLVDDELQVMDSDGDTATLTRVFEPRWSVLGARAVAAQSHRSANLNRNSLQAACGASNEGGM